jgi:hypothetical protein
MSNKKVGVMTLNNSNNYGAVLQCYALSRYLEHIGYDPFIVNFRGERPALLRYLASPIATLQKMMAVESPFKAIQTVIRKPKSIMQVKKELYLSEIFDRFRSDYLNVTEREYSYQTLKDNCPDALAYICGSDAVWATDAYFKSPSYLLGFVPDMIKKVAYAPSFGKGSLEPYQVDTFKRYLQDFDAISVREPSGVAIVKEVLGVKAMRVLDPTFLIDDYEEIIDQSVAPADPFILVYRLSQQPELSQKTRDLIDELASATGIKVINIEPNSGEILDHETEDFLPTPGQFLGLIKSAKYVLTNSFHGAVFSILFEKDFVCFPRDNAKDKKNLRMIELLDLVGLKARFCDKLHDSDAVMRILSVKYSIANVSSNLHAPVEASKNFLIDTLGNKNESIS